MNSDYKNISVDERVLELFYHELNIFAKKGIRPENLKKELYLEIGKNIAEMRDYYERNKDPFILHLYESWLAFENRVEDYLADITAYKMVYAWHRLNETNFSKS
jgi:tRNA U54 and U55 pseudouridine synthase Pus10